ncbi:MAG: DUF7384 family protein [Halobacteriota archaeon]
MDEETNASFAREDASPARIVVDADVLAADLLVGGDARRVVDHVREHSWMTLLASDALVDDAAAIVETLADASLAADWRQQIDTLRRPVDHPPGDHPALAAAFYGGAMHVVTFDERLGSVETGMALRDQFPVSIRHPSAFARLFDAESLYGVVDEGDYPGPDRDPRA